ncbi:MAG TPA: hypothetical protein PLM35_03865, partial [Cyclobacteriaceae bacterium]|nr:hypothetical protein [Cyclobacteriaceae bacterium]
AGLTYVSGSASIPVSVSGQELTFTIAALTLLDDNTSFTFQASVDMDVPFGSTLTNVADLTWSSQAGTVSGERNYTDSDSADVTASESTHIDASKTVSLVLDGNGDGLAQLGDTLEYEVILSNSGATATGVLFSDTLSTDVTYVGGSLTSSAGTVDDAAAPDLVVSIPSMAGGRPLPQA